MLVWIDQRFNPEDQREKDWGVATAGRSDSSLKGVEFRED